MLPGVDTDDDPGVGDELVPPGGPALPVLPAARASSRSRNQPSRTSSVQAASTVDRVRPVASIASVAVKAPDSGSSAYARTVSALVARGVTRRCGMPRPYRGASCLRD